MKILVDADACPVKNIIIDTAKQFGLQVLMFTDTSHVIEDSYSTVITVEQGKESVDIKLANNIQKGDLVITGDYGLAALALPKGAFVLNYNGLVYDYSNIDRLLFERFLSQKIRRAGKKTKTVKKRKKLDDQRFKNQLIKLCLKILNHC